MYVRESKGETLTFGVSGRLWRDALVMFDRSSRSLWAQVTGEAIIGAKKGERLSEYPSLQTTWRHWKALHPDTLVLSKKGSYGIRGREDRYSQYHLSNQVGVTGFTHWRDRRLPAKDLVFGVKGTSTQTAYPITRLATQRLVNDAVDSLPVVLIYSKADKAAIAWSRRNGDRTLTFNNLRDQAESLLMSDEESGSTWEVFSGRAIAGPRKGTRLQPLSAFQAYWYAWSNYYPHTRVWGDRKQ
ncbi:MAG: DUF3179 domain-containing protein [Acidobacteria bacterium]|nr:DUF3179 domain-containing protein [Acidobacteriota bacterium]